MTIDKTPPLPLTFNLLFCMYIHHGGFIPHVTYQNHVPDDFKIYQFRRVVFAGYAPYFTEGLTIPGHSIEQSVCIDFGPPITNSVIV